MANYNPVQTRLQAHAPLPRFRISYACTLTARHGNQPITLQGQYILAATDPAMAQARFHALFNVRYQLVHPICLTIQNVEKL